jgi:hypothetical protein
MALACVSEASIALMLLVTIVGVSNRCVVIIWKDQKIMRKFVTEKSQMMVQLTIASKFHNNLGIPLLSKVNHCFWHPTVSHHCNVQSNKQIAYIIDTNIAAILPSVIIHKPT